MRPFVLGLAVVLFAGCSAPAKPPDPSASPTTIQVTSPAYDEGGPIPPKYTCLGANVSMPLTFANLPTSHKSLAIIMDDPDAPSGTFTHWTVWNLHPQTKAVPEAANITSLGGREGTNAGKTGYRGPCPPSGTHHYHTKVYAVNVTLDLPQGASVAELTTALKGNVAARGELVGTFSKST